ncbi:MAG: LuxR C-terminal-related transcriptional regulator [Gammaproteobacteria bacterium]
MADAGLESETLPLTPRQLEIFRLLARGLSNREICELLNISSNTVKIHVAAILRNLNVSNRTEAVYAYREMLDETEPASELSARVRIADRIGRPAIAVLPFEDLQTQPDEEHLLDGLMEELLVRLSSWQWFPVIAYASSRAFRMTESDPRSIGDKLGARYLIGGSLRRSDKRIRVTVRLVDTDSGVDLWSNRFDAELGDLFQLQALIARNIVTTLAPGLLLAEEEQLDDRKPTGYSTWELCCRGLQHLNRATREDAERALTCFDRAIAQDEDFSLGWHGRVSTLQLQLYEQWADDPARCVRDLCEAANRCLQADPRSAHAHADVGLANILLGRREEAIHHLEQSVSINPSSARALNLLSQAYGMVGRLDECIMQLEELLRIDPHSTSAFRYRTILGMCHFLSGQFDEAIAAARDAIAARADATGAYLALIAALQASGDHSGAQRAIQELKTRAPNFTLAGRLNMMRPFTDETLLERLLTTLTEAGLAE